MASQRVRRLLALATAANLAAGLAAAVLLPRDHPDRRPPRAAPVPATLGPDVDGDGLPDPVEVVAAAGRWGVVAHLSGRGDRTAWQRGAGAVLYGAADLDADGRAEVVVRTADGETGRSYAVATLVGDALRWVVRDGDHGRPMAFRSRAGVTPAGWGCGDVLLRHPGIEVYQTDLDLTESPVRASGVREVYVLRAGRLLPVRTEWDSWHPLRELPRFDSVVACGTL